MRREGRVAHDRGQSTAGISAGQVVRSWSRRELESNPGLDQAGRTLERMCEHAPGCEQPRRSAKPGRSTMTLGGRRRDSSPHLGVYHAHGSRTALCCSVSCVREFQRDPAVQSLASASASAIRYLLAQPPCLLAARVLHSFLDCCVVYEYVAASRGVRVLLRGRSA